MALPRLVDNGTIVTAIDAAIRRRLADLVDILLPGDCNGPHGYG
jgi:hypothetical protein